MQEIQLRARIQNKSQKWDKVEVDALLKYYPLYKSGNQRYSPGVLRGMLKSRTMSAISKKYWSIMGSEHKQKDNIQQVKFDFLQEKLNA